MGSKPKGVGSSVYVSFSILLAALLCANIAKCVQRRDYSIASTLVRYITERSDYEESDAEHSRVTQAPLVKVHLKKVFLPTLLHGAMKNDINQVRTQRASDIDSENNRKRDDIMATIAAVDTLESLAAEPLNMMNAHNYTQREYKSKFRQDNEKRDSAVVQEPYGLSDFAVLSQTTYNYQPAQYRVLERNRLKPSELDNEDGERYHVPLFPERGDKPVGTT
ncbi:putative integral membrane protein [Babesia bovis T2Bo]|uniref:putative integral membrane protein n=1 Tax=Babesia bovis T2Bo TaxID=484906 RepID=UPI001C3479FE|nr:putative integral membrane protein [Babesia bovis T2Bo]EDO05422.2 putative integral membrane protein [Babesia bovis T2Bo]